MPQAPAAARRGRWVWKAPIGYRHAPHRDGRPVGLELDPEQAPHIARAFELVAGGVTVDAAFRDCTAAGLRNPKGQPIGRQTFHSIFQKPIYAGRLEVAADAARPVEHLTPRRLDVGR